MKTTGYKLTDSGGDQIELEKSKEGHVWMLDDNGNYIFYFQNQDELDFFHKKVLELLNDE